MGELWGAESTQARSQTEKKTFFCIKMGRKEGEDVSNKGFRREAYWRLKDEVRVDLY